MLNLISSSTPKWRRTWTDIAGACCAGLILMLGIIVWLETDAQSAMATLMVHSQTAKSSQDSKPVQDAETALSQLELAALKARVMHLSRRQTEREDLTDVQHILLRKFLSSTGQSAQLQNEQNEQSVQSLIWQNGTLEFEALGESSGSWQSLMNELNGFDRWKTAPQVIQTHRTATQAAIQAPPHGPSQVAYILKAHLWTHATSASSPSTTKSAP
jgi:hypothetical protein